MGRQCGPAPAAKNTLTSYSEWLYGYDENFDEETFLTGLTKVSPLGGTEEGAFIYNLAGQRLSKTQRGINIVGGKKVLIK